MYLWDPWLRLYLISISIVTPLAALGRMAEVDLKTLGSCAARVSRGTHSESNLMVARRIHTYCALPAFSAQMNR